MPIIIIRWLHKTPASAWFLPQATTFEKISSERIGSVHVSLFFLQPPPPPPQLPETAYIYKDAALPKTADGFIGREVFTNALYVR